VYVVSLCLDPTCPADEHRVTIRMFADDTQLYVHCGRDNTALTIVRLQHCVMDINHWMSANQLKLKVDKTELIWIGTKYSVTARNASFLSLRLGANVIPPSQHVRLLGVVISADLGLEKHVSNVSATCFHHLRQLRHIRRSLSTESATTLVHAFVTFRIDYCNVVFVAPKSVTGKLQRVLNAADRVVSGTRKFDHGLTQLLLHWLDVHERIKYKLCMMMRRCQDGPAPQYLAVHWSPVSETASRQHLRSAGSHQLTVPPHRRTTYGSRAFAVAGPLTWNSLPKRQRDPS